jgi:hypothetical protein
MSSDRILNECDRIALCICVHLLTIHVPHEVQIYQRSKRNRSLGKQISYLNKSPGSFCLNAFSLASVRPKRLTIVSTWLFLCI